MAKLIIELRQESTLEDGSLGYDSLGYIQQDVTYDVFPRLTLSPSNALKFDYEEDISTYSEEVIFPAMRYFNRHLPDGKVVYRFLAFESVLTEVM